ncbi:hypothetical protein [Clostridioides difficile]|nr:hypothetical protein [Clostridioides difficile]
MSFNIGTKRVPPPEPKTPFINPVKTPIIVFFKLKSKYFFFKSSVFS